VIDGLLEVAQKSNRKPNIFARVFGSKVGAHQKPLKVVFPSSKFVDCSYSKNLATEAKLS